MRRFRKNSVLFVTENGKTLIYKINSSDNLQRLRNYFNAHFKYHAKSDTYSCNI